MKKLQVISGSFVNTPVGFKRSDRVEIENEGTEPVKLTDITSDIAQIYPENITEDIQTFPKPPANSTLFFDVYFSLVDDNGEYYTEDQGFGVAGSTDSEGNITVDIVTAEYYEDIDGSYFTDTTGEPFDAI